MEDKSRKPESRGSGSFRYPMSWLTAIMYADRPLGLKVPTSQRSADDYMQDLYTELFNCNGDVRVRLAMSCLSDELTKLPSKRRPTVHASPVCIDLAPFCVFLLCSSTVLVEILPTYPPAVGKYGSPKLHR